MKYRKIHTIVTIFKKATSYFLEFRKKKISKYALAVIAGGILTMAINNMTSTSGAEGGQKIEIEGAKVTHEITRELEFPLRDGQGDEVASIKYELQRAELRDEIVVEGRRATAVAGRTFLIIVLKVTNEFEQPVEIDTRDYIRLVVNGVVEEKLAPDIHNDPVEVQAISTKFTRVGFPINDTDQDLLLLVGEIDGDKEEIRLEFN